MQTPFNCNLNCLIFNQKFLSYRIWNVCCLSFPPQLQYKNESASTIAISHMAINTFLQPTTPPKSSRNQCPRILGSEALASNFNLSSAPPLQKRTRIGLQLKLLLTDTLDQTTAKCQQMRAMAYMTLLLTRYTHGVLIT